MRGKWDQWYADAPAEPEARYFDTVTFKLGAEWLEDCDLVEDWGCGLGWFKTYVGEDRYRGIDGSKSPNCTKVADLRLYKSTVEGIFMRGALEHNLEWEKVLKNFVGSFTKRAVLVLFTPMSLSETYQIDWIEELGVPDMSFNHDELMTYFDGIWFKFEDHASESAYGIERIYYLEKE